MNILLFTLYSLSTRKSFGWFVCVAYVFQTVHLEL